jgi:uncharacterized protein (TIGR00266 family)
MEVEIVHGPGNAAAKVRLASGESFTAEGGAMIAMSADMRIETNTHTKSGGGGMLKAMKRALAGESFFVNHFTAGPGGGEVWLGATLAGDMLTRQLDGGMLVVQGGSFVCAEPGVKLDLGWQGLKSMFSGESMFWIHLSGRGLAVLSSYGAIYPLEVDGAAVVDTGHIVAFDETLSFSVRKAGKSLIGSFLGGEGLVCRFEGRGTVWCQSHNASAFGKLIGPKLKPR